MSLETRDPKGLKFSFFGKGKTGPTDYDNLIRNEDTGEALDLSFESERSFTDMILLPIVSTAATLGGTRLQRGWRWVKDNPWKTSLMVAVPVAAGLTTGGLVIGAKEGLFGVHERKTVQEWNVQEEKLDVLSRMEKQGMTKLPQPSTL